MLKGIKSMMVKGLKGFKSELNDTAETFGSINFLIFQFCGLSLFTIIILLFLSR